MKLKDLKNITNIDEARYQLEELAEKHMELAKKYAILDDKYKDLKNAYLDGRKHVEKSSKAKEKSANELWKEAGFPYCRIEDDYVEYYTDHSEGLGTRYVTIDCDSFDAWEYSVHEGNSPIDFTPKMTKALLKQLEEFKEKNQKTNDLNDPWMLLLDTHRRTTLALIDIRAELNKANLEAQMYFGELCDGGWAEAEYHQWHENKPLTEQEIKDLADPEEALLWDNAIGQWILASLGDNTIIYSMFGYKGKYLLKFEPNRYFLRKPDEK